jgi:FkbM family methyltransferase
MFLRSWPFPRGAGRIIDTCFSNLKFEENVVVVQTTDDFEMKILPNDLIGRHIYLTGEFDRSIVEVLCNFASIDDTLLDIGANVGYVSACFLKNVPGSKVIAVEPQPQILDLLHHNLQLFGPDRQRVIPVALSDRDGEGWLNVCDWNRGAGSIAADKNQRTTRVDVWSVDRFFSYLNISKLDLVKLDVEGHEEIILRHCTTAFERLHPRAILFEEHGRKSAPDGPIGNLLQRIGYRVLGIRKRLTRLELIPILDQTDCHFNDYIAISQKRSIPQRAVRAYGRWLQNW